MTNESSGPSHKLEAEDLIGVVGWSESGIRNESSLDQFIILHRQDGSQVQGEVSFEVAEQLKQQYPKR